MEMQGSQTIAATPAAVWAALNDPAVLKQCIPGCQTLEPAGENGYAATVAAKVGPVSARFSGRVTLSDIDPPNGYTISGEGSGGVAGFAKGGAQVRLSAVDGGTLLTYTAKGQVGGKLAQIGARLIDAAAAKMADDFFSRFNQIVAAAAPPPVEAAPAAEAPPPPGAPAATAAPGISPYVWVPILIAAMFAVLALVVQG
jgi:carbon monoxide dehydrogenase subunit G